LAFTKEQDFPMGNVTRRVIPILVLAALALGIASGATRAQDEGAAASGPKKKPIPDSWCERDIRSKTFWNLRTQDLPPLNAKVWHNVEKPPLKLEDLRGKVVVLAFWATWNKQSLQAIPKLQQFEEKYGPDGLQIIGICNPFKGEEMVTTVDSLNIKWPICLDERKKIIDAYLVDGYPDFYLIDRYGKLRVVDCTNEALEEAIQLLIEEPGPKPPPESAPANPPAAQAPPAADGSETSEPPTDTETE
jgi:thiol-disulfide isomerase/thioredoxin